MARPLPCTLARGSSARFASLPKFVSSGPAVTPVCHFYLFETRYMFHSHTVEEGADMEDRLTKARQYRDEATRLRSLAARDNNELTRKALVDMAENYERLAAGLVQLAEDESNSAPGKL